MKYILVLFSLLASIFSVVAAPIDSLEVAPSPQIEEATDATQAPIKPDTLWDSANTAYINGDYSAAVALYGTIEQQGLVSAKLFYNMGNAHYKLDDMARAILYYQRALLLSPNDEDTLYNLGIAQSQIKDQIEVIPEFFVRKWSRSVARMLDCTGWTILSLVALVALLAALLAFFLSGSIAMRKWSFGVGLLAAVIGCAATLYALDDRRELLDHNSAVVMSQSISIKSSPDRSATDLFMLHSGTTVQIIRSLDDWHEIVIADGKKGWIESRRVEKI
ncbi:MAG: tetratricopeptide repeat protein [Rikenellaceae bacterium]